MRDLRQDSGSVQGFDPQAGAQIVRLARKLGVSVVSDKLDFTKKKQALEDSDDSSKDGMLSSFAYSAFDAAFVFASFRQNGAHAE